MSLLRIYGSLAPGRCSWALIDEHQRTVPGEGRISDLPGHADHVQLILPAAQVLLTRARLPAGARRLAGSILAFAVEEQITGDPDASQVTWLGMAGDDDVLAVVDRQGLQRWQDALDTVAIRSYEIHCETLLLPRKNGEWSLAWDGREGFVRSGELEGAATDSGDRHTPPLSLQMLLDEAEKTGTRPASIAVYVTTPDTAPDLEAWQKVLGVVLRPAGEWHWRTAQASAGICLAQVKRNWRAYAGLAEHLRPAAWILGAAVVIHAAALVVDWASLAHQQQSLQQGMEKRFRATFPEAVAVVDPALQMRRKLAEVRHAAGKSDSSDFLAMADKTASVLKALPAGSVRIVSYENGRMTIELISPDEASTHRIAAGLQQSGLVVDMPITSPRAGSGTVVLTVRPS